MKLGETQPFASPEEALKHYGVKGMRWGVRDEDELKGRTRSEKKVASPPPRTEAEKKEARKAMAKKAAIGAGVLTAVAGTAFVAYKLNQRGSLPLSAIKQVQPKQAETVKKVIAEQKDVIMLTRGKYKAGTFLKKGDTPNFFTHWENAFVNELKDPHTASAFEKLRSGAIAAAFPDPGKRFDFSGRPISHQVIIPKSMTPGIESIKDVEDKIWPQLKDTYDVFYKESEKLPKL